MSDNNERAAMLDKLNAAFERAIETEEPKTAEEPEVSAYEHVSHDVEGLYGDDARAHADAGETARAADEDEDDDWEDEARPAKKRGGAGKVIAIVLGALIVLLLAGATLIAEPWVKAPVDSYVAPTEYTALPDVTIKAGDDYFFDNITLGANEVLSKVEITDTDILSTNGVDLIHSAGEYFSTPVRVTVSEQEVIPLTTAKEFSLFGKDLSAPYNKIRSKLRDLLGIEKTGAERTELRALALYEMNVTVDGFISAQSETVEASTSTSADIAPVVPEGEDIRFTSKDSGVTVTVEQETSTKTAYTYKSGDTELIVIKAATGTDGTEYYINGKKSGETVTAVAETGFWKKVDADTYARYLEATGQTAPTAEEGETPEHLNEIFVPTETVEYAVTVK